MDPIERVLGRLEEHKEQANRRFDVLEGKVDKLWNWRMKIAGVEAIGAAAISVIVTVIVQIVIS